MSVEKLIGKSVLLTEYQTTFCILEADRRRHRINFFDKKEFKLQKGTVAHLEFFQIHPLLLNFNESINSTYINSPPANVDIFVEDIKNAICEATLGWRHWTNYIEIKSINFKEDNFLQNVRNGSGILANAPLSISRKIIEVCERHKVSTTTLGEESSTENFKLLIIGNSYVIAREFKLKS